MERKVKRWPLSTPHRTAEPAWWLNATALAAGRHHRWATQWGRTGCTLAPRGCSPAPAATPRRPPGLPHLRRRWANTAACRAEQGWGRKRCGLAPAEQEGALL